MTIDHDAAVNAILEKNGVTFFACNMGTREDALGGKHAMDAWACTFTNAKRPHAPESFDYFTGLGHRAPASKHEKMRVALLFQGLTENDKAGRTQYGKRYLQAVENARKPVAPMPAGVLYCLILDSDAARETFNSWCGNFGYDSDSRKAHGVYLACQETADKLARIFSYSVIEELREALEDY